MTTPDPPPGRTESLRGPIRPWILLTAILFALATVLALAWPAGGLREFTPETPHRRLGEPITGHRLAMKPYKVSFLAKDPAPSLGDAKPGRFLAIELEVTNVSHQTATVSDLALNLRLTVSPSGATIDRFRDKVAGFVIRDGRFDRDQLQPGLTERVMIVYTVPVPLPDPTHLTMTVIDKEYVGGFQSDLSEWYDVDDPLAIYDLDVGR
ncbi:hypothetical protein GCM10022226_02550 [Sphaerisporangium flaviroseum]|uniref:DUF4352 domain-containing protein n=1 Tax=Sphaerisporangium flaviroseum TaxID=509199 RepID=A0ABP7HAR3_9ACTN